MPAAQVKGEIDRAVAVSITLFAGLLVSGAGTATSRQARYACADLVVPARRTKVISTVLGRHHPPAAS
ncbi:hypothetical protein [Amycolatopsis sp. VC5-11]|uniref:hypothetical protein n=1 Tax=Amycolatopsis sp. VC5-11 TaxID=3120156 RepID=UPI00300A2DF3